MIIAKKQNLNHDLQSERAQHIKTPERTSTKGQCRTFKDFDVYLFLSIDMIMKLFKD